MQNARVCVLISRAFISNLHTHKKYFMIYDLATSRSYGIMN